jgi:predicted RNA-binding protein with PIN domain
MPYIVDGHNLIPNAGLHLDSPNDEMDLVALLQEFSRTSRAEVEVYFDGAPPGQAGTYRFGTVTAHFVQLESTADSAIIDRLHLLGRTAKNWTVVSSDRQVRQAAVKARARAVTAESFARRLSTVAVRKQQSGTDSTPAEEPRLSAEEIQHWLAEFGKRQ